MAHLAAVERFLEATAPSAELAPLVEAVRGLAGLLDSNPSDSKVWREYRFMLRELMGRVGSDVGDALEAEFAALDG